MVVRRDSFGSWRAIAPRIATDFALINLALLVAVLLRVVVGFLQTSDPELRSVWVERSIELYGYNVGIIVAITLLVFTLLGFYTKTRFYARRYKILTVLQGTGIAGLSYVTLVYMVNKSWLLPRGTAILTFMLIFALCGGMRILKWRLASRYVVQQRDQQTRRGIPETVLVVGGAGHLGSALCRELLSSGFKVRVLDLLMFGDDAIRELYANPNFEFIKGDFRHVEMVVKATSGVDAVVHLGAIVGDPACAVDEDYSVDVNFAATRMIRDVCRGFGVSRFVFASTCSVYGAADHTLEERSELNPVSLYARTKVDSEKALLALHDQTFSPTVLRLATVFGLSPRPRFDLVVNLVTAMAVREGKCKIFGGDQWRPFIHVRDVARGIIAVLQAREEIVAGEIFNVGDDRLNSQLSEIGDLIEELIPDAEVVREEHNVDRRNYRVSFKKIRDRLGFRCGVELSTGVEEIREALQRGNIDDFRDPHYSNLNYLKRLRDAGDPSTRKMTETAKVLTLRRSPGGQRNHDKAVV